MSNNELLYHWPKNAAGEPEEAALLEVAADFPGHRDVLCSLLENFGIPYYTRRKGLSEISYIRGGFSHTGIHIYVPRSRLEEAVELLHTPPEFGEEEFEEESP